MAADNDTWIKMAQSSINQGMDPSEVYRNIAEAVGEEEAARVRAEVERRAGRIKNLKEPRSLVDPRIPNWYTGPTTLRTNHKSEGGCSFCLRLPAHYRMLSAV